MADDHRRGWRRKTGMVQFERTSAWPYASDWAFKRGTDAPLTRRGRLLWGIFLTVVVLAGVVLLAVSR
jgi:hypothetical protein